MHSQAVDDTPIIVIDDDETMRRACQAALRRTGYKVETYADGPSGLRRIEEIGASLLVVDLKMPEMGGMEVIERVKKIDPDLVVIVITGFATVSTAVESMKGGAYDFIPKPFTADELRVIIARGMEHHQLVTESKRLRQEKEAQARKFVTFVSHQLQSPLGAVQQYLDVLCHQAGDSISPEHLKWIARSGKKISSMLEIIGDWLTISKVEGGQLATERIPVYWKGVLAEVLETHAVAARERRITLSDELPDELPPVIGDPIGLRMVLSNLVGNAVKYNRPDGEVRVIGEADDSTVTLSVIDTGVGISAEDHSRVFEEFFRSKGEDAAVQSGTGMGLPICQKIVEELCGRITLTSEPGVGSTFSVVLARSSSAVSESPSGSGP
ncbi:MAG: response regulator [bacterium]|nr:response regulator [bacterium]